MQRAIQRPIYRAIRSGLLTLPGGFNPSSLFTGTDKGYIYDNNDLTSFYLDSALTTQATVNGLVGGQMDKSGGLALGSELRALGVIGLAGSATVATYNTGTGVGTVTRVDAANQSYVQWSGLSANAFYKITLQNTGGGGQNINIRSGDQGAATAFTVNFGTTVTGFAQASAGGLITITAAGAATVPFTLQSIALLSGNHRYQATTGNKPILRGTPVGGNIVTNGDFADGTGWTLGAGVNISGGTLNVDGTVSQSGGIVLATPTTPFAVAIGRVYRIEWRLVSYSSTETISIQIGGASGAVRSAAGTFVEYLTATTTGQFNIITRGAPATRTATIDNIVIHDVSADAVTAPYALQFDGVDDFLQTAAVDFTATDKMTVCHGVRKLAQGVRQMLVEHNGGSLPGFSIEAPGASGTGYRVSSGGSGLSQAAITGYDDVTSRVTSAVCDIAGDSAILRVNGTAVSTAVADQGTGNYANAILYFGRRGGASLPYNGLEYSSVCIGRLLTAAELANVERWVGRKTGVTL